MARTCWLIVSFDASMLAPFVVFTGGCRPAEFPTSMNEVLAMCAASAFRSLPGPPEVPVGTLQGRLHGRQSPTGVRASPLRLLGRGLVRGRRGHGLSMHERFCGRSWRAPPPPAGYRLTG